MSTISSGAVNTCLVSAGFGPVSAGHSPSDLDAQLAKYQAELADWKACPSHDTPEGKAHIQTLQQKVDEIHQQQRAMQQQPAAAPTDNAVSGGVLPLAQTGPLGRTINLKV